MSNETPQKTDNSKYITVILWLILQFAGVIIWGATLDNRVNNVELAIVELKSDKDQRSRDTYAIVERLTRLEEQQKVTNQLLQSMVKK